MDEVERENILIRVSPVKMFALLLLLAFQIDAKSIAGNNVEEAEELRRIINDAFDDYLQNKRGVNVARDEKSLGESLEEKKEDAEKKEGLQDLMKRVVELKDELDASDKENNNAKEDVEQKAEEMVSDNEVTDAENKNLITSREEKASVKIDNSIDLLTKVLDKRFSEYIMKNTGKMKKEEKKKSEKEDSTMTKRGDVNDASIKELADSINELTDLYKKKKSEENVTNEVKKMKHRTKKVGLHEHSDKSKHVAMAREIPIKKESEKRSEKNDVDEVKGSSKEDMILQLRDAKRGKVKSVLKNLLHVLEGKKN